MADIRLSKPQIRRIKLLAKKIAGDIRRLTRAFSTTSVERSLLRLYGVDGTDDHGYPVPNRIVDMLSAHGLIRSGASKAISRAMLQSGKDIQETCRLVIGGKLDLGSLGHFSQNDVGKMEQRLLKHATSLLDGTRKRKKRKQKKYKLPPQPWKYIIVATGNVYEDRTQAESAVFGGADIIAVIRSTAQSLLDYVPYGATTHGIGGTYATQENFRIMREALDELSGKHGRYIRLVNYASGLCMPEIAACAAIEDLDILLNDSMYGILFRDINKKRTFIDQFFSRLICARSGIMINTGEDNYLTTSDAVEKAHTVTASQLINEAMAKQALLPDELLGLGHAFEIDPAIENSFLYELAHAQLARQLFPGVPIKYMPPTKHMSPDIFYSHSLDSMFNLASIMTDQGIHLTGILSEAIHNPLMHDRFEAMKNVNYIFNAAKDLGTEIQFKKDGFIQKRAEQVLNETENLLKKIETSGLMKAISRGKFGDIKRLDSGGKGKTGVFKKAPDYSNPVMDRILADGVIHG